MNRNDFLSNQNSNVVYHIIRKTILETSTKDIEENKIYFKKQVDNIMVSLWDNRDTLQLTGNRENRVVQFNKQIIRICVPQFIQSLKANQNTQTANKIQDNNKQILVDSNNNSNNQDGLDGFLKHNDIYKKREVDFTNRIEQLKKPSFDLFIDDKSKRIEEIE